MIESTRLANIESPANIESSVYEFLAELVVKHVHVRREDIDADCHFIEMGVTSTQLVTMATLIEESLGVHMNPALFFEYPRLGAFTKQLVLKHAPEIQERFLRNETSQTEADDVRSRLAGIPVMEKQIDLSLDNIDETKLADLQDCFDRYGDIFLTRDDKYGAPVIFINRPEWIHHVLVEKQRSYVKGPGTDEARLLMGDGVAITDGRVWREQRALIQPFFASRNLAALQETMHRHNRMLLNRWEQSAACDEAIDITLDVSRLILDITLSTVFSEDYVDHSGRGSSNPFSFIADDFVRDVAFVERWAQNATAIRQIIAKRTADKRCPTDYLSHLMQASMTTEQIIDEINTFIIAGHETTATTLNFVWLLISQHADVEQRLVAETQFLGGEPPTLEEVKKLSFTKQVIQEAMRLYPSFWLITRTALEDDEVGEFTIPKGAHIFISPYFIQRHPSYWDRAAQFDPERFSKENATKVPRGAYIPFGMGPRSCLGMQLSMIEMQVHIAYFIQRLVFRSADKLQWKLVPAINLHTEDSIYLKLRRRQSHAETAVNS